MLALFVSAAGLLIMTPSLHRVHAVMVISEILPKPSDDVSEWIELYNTGPGAVSLNGWKLSSAKTGTSFTFGPDVTVEPATFISFFQYQSGITLHNEGDTVTLTDAAGTVVDRQSYESILGYNISMGRALDASGTWAVCLSQTPDAVNDCPVPTPTPTPLPSSTPTVTPSPTAYPVGMVITSPVHSAAPPAPVEAVLAAATSLPASAKPGLLQHIEYRTLWIAGITIGIVLVILLLTLAAYTWEKNRNSV